MNATALQQQTYWQGIHVESMAEQLTGNHLTIQATIKAGASMTTSGIRPHPQDELLQDYLRQLKTDGDKKEVLWKTKGPTCFCIIQEHLC